MRFFTSRAIVAAAAGAIALGTVGLTPAAADGLPVPPRQQAPEAYDPPEENYEAQPPAAYQYPAPPPVNNGYAYPPAYYPGVARPYMAGPPGFIAPPYRRYVGPVYGRQVYGGPMYGRPYYGARGYNRHHW